MSTHGSKRKVSFTDTFEETLIAVILGLMTLITFVNVVIRYVFNAEYFKPITIALGLPTNLLWSVEVTLILFAWLVLLGVSYCVKITAHLGVDVIVNMVTPKVKRAMTIVACLACIFYAFLLLKGGWDYWANFANLPQTTGRWFPTGFQEKFLAKGWYETSDVTMLPIFNFLSDWFNGGEPYEKMPRLVPYLVLPIGMALLLFRFCQASLSVLRGERDMLIVSHEVDEEAVEEAAATIAAQEAKLNNAKGSGD